MKIRRFIFLIATLITTISLGQSTIFIKSYGNTGYDFGRDILQTPDTGYIATGSSSSFGSSEADAFLLKIDSVGDFKWSYNYGGPGSDWGESVVITNDSSYAIGGYTNSFGAGGFDFYLVRTAIDGTPLWEKTYGGSDWDRAYALAQLPDSGFVLVGETYSFGVGDLDIYIVRTDKNGEEIWSQTYGGTGSDFASDVVIHGDSIVVVGSTNSEGSGDYDGILLKYHIDGTLGSKMVVGESGEDHFNAIKMKDDYYIMGGSRSYNYFGGCDCGLDFWVYKVDTISLGFIVDTTWNGEQLGEDIVYDISVTSNNDIYYAGTTTSWGSVDIGDGYTDAFLNKFLNNYYTVFDYIKNFGEIGHDYLKATDICFDEGVVGIGSSPFGSTGGYNVLIVRNDRLNTAGSFTILETTYDNITLDIPALEKSDQLKIYPTIVEDLIQIEGTTGSYTLTIYDLNGRCVYNTVSDQKSHDLSNLTSGYYVLAVISEGKTFKQKIVKK